jgi:hypothetical protein
VAIDSEFSAPQSKAEPLGPAIENELPTYRAIPRSAVTSVVLGVLALLSFVTPAFLIAAVLAVLFGARAAWLIKQQPDLYTGRGFAHAGLILGLVSGLSSVSYGAAQDFLLRRSAEQFLRNSLLPILQEHDLDSAIWYKVPPDTRRGMDPSDARKQLQTSSSGRPDPLAFESQAGPVAKLCRHLEAEPGARVELDRIEATRFDGNTPVILALLRIRWPHEHEHDPAKYDQPGDYAAVVLKNKRDGRKLLWWVQDYVYPYQPNTYVEPAKPIDDGHGHGGHGH